MTIRAQTRCPHGHADESEPSRCCECGGVHPLDRPCPYAHDELTTFTGRFLDPGLTWLIDPRADPGPGYAVGRDGRLWRNGEHVGFVLAVTFNRGAVGHWVDYESWAGSPMDRRELGA